MNNFIPISEPSITQKEIDYVADAVKSGWVSSIGVYIDNFEKKFAEFVGTKYSVATSNGTTALHLALLSYGIGEGDEVIMPDFSFVATANAVVYTGAKPVMVDIEPETWNIDYKCIEKAITDKTKAVMPVHIYGHPANMLPIMELAKKHNLIVIEDAAEAHGAEVKEKKVGSFGNCGTFSFYGNKIVTTGEGGIITTDDEQIYQKARFLRDHAMSKDKRYWHTEIGFNYRMTNLQAALGLAQIERVEELLAKKRQIFSWYQEFLAGVTNIKLNPQMSWAKNVYWMICLLLDENIKISRDEFIVKLKEQGIDSRPFFYPMSLMPMYNREKTDNPVAYSISPRGLNLPSSVNLEKDQVKYICDVIKKILE